MHRDGECCHHRPPKGFGKRKLTQVQRSRFTQVGDRLIDGFALRRGTSLRVQGDKTALFCRCQYRSQFHMRALLMVRVALYQALATETI